MILKVKETNKELYSAKFEILHQDTVVGNIDFKGKLVLWKVNLKLILITINTIFYNLK